MAAGGPSYEATMRLTLTRAAPRTPCREPRRQSSRRINRWRLSPQDDPTGFDVKQPARTYLLLTRVEDRFRAMKELLLERLLFDYLASRVETRLFLSLACLP